MLTLGVSGPSASLTGISSFALDCVKGKVTFGVSGASLTGVIFKVIVASLMSSSRYLM